MEEMLKELKGHIDALNGRVENIDNAAAELKSLDETVAALKADLAEIKGDAEGEPELKSLDAVADRLDSIERKVNQIGADGNRPAGDKAERKSFDRLDAAMRAGEPVEVKSLDSDLKEQDVFHDLETLTRDYPILAGAYRRPTTADQPRVSYAAGAAVTIKGDEDSSGQTHNVRKKVVLTVKTYEYQQPLDQEDVDDAGAWLMEDERNEGSEATKDRLNADLVDAVEDAVTDEADGVPDDEYDEIQRVDTAADDTLTDADIDNLVAALDVKYRRGAVFVGSAAMVAKLRNIRDDATGVSLWTPSLKEGTPPTLKGFAFIEDENVADDVLLLGNLRRGLAVAEREKFALSNIERSGGDYLPYFRARYGRGVKDPRAWKAIKITTAG